MAEDLVVFPNSVLSWILYDLTDINKNACQLITKPKCSEAPGPSSSWWTSTDDIPPLFAVMASENAVDDRYCEDTFHETSIDVQPVLGQMCAVLAAVTIAPQADHPLHPLQVSAKTHAASRLMCTTP